MVLFLLRHHTCIHRAMWTAHTSTVQKDSCDMPRCVTVIVTEGPRRHVEEPADVHVAKDSCDMPRVTVITEGPRRHVVEPANVHVADGVVIPLVIAREGSGELDELGAGAGERLC